MRTRWIPFAVVLAVALVAAVWVVSADPSPSRHDKETSWHGVVAGVARHVEKIRSLTFEHDVPVTFVDHETLATRYHESAHVSWQQAQEIAGFYDPKRDSVFVLGSEGAAESQVLLAHELTHVLQNQHFDIPNLAKTLDEQGGFGVQTDLQEGDAMLVFDEYAARLEANGTLTPRRAARLGYGGRLGPATTAYTARMAPYLLAPSALRVYRALGSTGHSVDNLFANPPKHDDAFLTPSKFFVPGWDRFAPTPTTDTGDDVIADNYQFSALRTYLMLAERLDPKAALRIADGWADAGAVDFRRGPQVCTRVRFAGNSAAADTAFADGLAQWVAEGNGADSVTTEPSTKYGPTAILTWCRVADTARTLVRNPKHLLMVAASRNHIEAELVTRFGPTYAECAADAAMDEPDFDGLVADAERYPSRVPAQLHRASTEQHLVALAHACTPLVYGARD